MASVSEQPSPSWGIDRLRRHFGGIPAERIRLDPPPGTASEADLLRANDHGDIICELVDGTLVEKAVGINESILAGVIIQFLRNYMDRNPRGLVTAPDGGMRLVPGLVRLPDVGFLSWERIGADELPDAGWANFAPDLAIEVISKSNTKREIARKLGEYFAHGTREVWVILPKKRSADVYTSPQEKREIGPDGALDGGDILPGFSLPLPDLFAALRRPRQD